MIGCQHIWAGNHKAIVKWQSGQLLGTHCQQAHWNGLAGSEQRVWLSTVWNGW